MSDFIKRGLPSLLAPGNIPALIKAANVRFVVLTEKNSIDFFEENAAFQKLKSICEVEFILIDDLIVDGQYSTTLTYAFERAIRNTAQAMLETYFILLSADYVMANGSFEGLLRYIAKGYSAIFSGNFLIIQEEVEEYFANQVDSDLLSLNIPPRQLLEYSFQHLHPTMISSVLNVPAMHNYFANRFFYRYDRQIIAARFYLLHPLCLKPETSDFKIGSSCDYSFVPAMCPSDNVAIITDSDDYLVVEPTPSNHEYSHVRLGSFNQAMLGRSLAEWTTKRHRENAKTSIYFHSRDILATEQDTIENYLQDFYLKMHKILCRYKEQPDYGHVYWIGAEEAYKKRKKIKGVSDLGNVELSYQESKSGSLKVIFNEMFGIPVRLRPWHYRYQEYRKVQKVLKNKLLPTNKKNMFIYADSDTQYLQFCQWFKNMGYVSHHYLAQYLKINKSIFIDVENEQFERIVVVASLSHLPEIVRIMDALKLMLKSNGRILFVIQNEIDNFPAMPVESIFKMSELVNSKYSITDVSVVYDNWSYLGSFTSRLIRGFFVHARITRYLLLGLAMLVGRVASFFRSILPYFKESKSGYCAYLLISLDVVNGNN